MRYQQWWFSEFPKQFKKYYDEVIVLGENTHSIFDPNIKAIGPNFSPINQSINFELDQIKEFMSMKIYEDDVMFVSDLSFPGFFLNAISHKIMKNVYAFVHATSINKLDYFEKVKDAKIKIEIGQSELCKKIFVSSEYHKNKLIPYMNETKICNLNSFPIHPELASRGEFKKENRKNFIVSVSRNSQQRIDLELENELEKRLGLKIFRKNDFETWDEYYNFLEDSEILLVTTKEETYGISAVEAALCGCTPFVPNKFSYPNLFHSDCLWNSKDDLLSKINTFIKEKESQPFNYFPKNLTEQTYFYENLLSQIKD